jgi:hypothetical protein
MIPHKHEVTFRMPPSTSRLPRDDEYYVMQQFYKHVTRCTHCDRQCFTSSRRIYARSLCADGHALGSDVRKYLYHYKGYAYSTWELTKDRIPIQVEVPAKFTCIRQLLHAVEYGLQLERLGGTHLCQRVAHENQQRSTTDGGTGSIYYDSLFRGMSTQSAMDEG